MSTEKVSLQEKKEIVAAYLYGIVDEIIERFTDCSGVEVEIDNPCEIGMTYARIEFFRVKRED